MLPENMTIARYWPQWRRYFQKVLKDKFFKFALGWNLLSYNLSIYLRDDFSYQNVHYLLLSNFLWCLATTWLGFTEIFRPISSKSKEVLKKHLWKKLAVSKKIIILITYINAFQNILIKSDSFQKVLWISQNAYSMFWKSTRYFNKISPIRNLF